MQGAGFSIEGFQVQAAKFSVEGLKVQGAGFKASSPSSSDLSSGFSWVSG